MSNEQTKKERKEDRLQNKLKVLRKQVAGVEASTAALEKNMAVHRDSEALFRVMVDSIREAVFLTDAEGNFKYISPAAPGVFHLTLREIEDFGTVYQLLGADVYDLYDPDELELNGEVRDIELQIAKKNGEILFLSIDIKHVDIKEGALLFICSDDSKCKNTEMKLAETDKSLAEMLYIASHDLQVPLISMEGYTAELLESYQDKLDDEGVHFLKRAQANARRMNLLVMGLLELSRLNTRSFPPETFKAVDMVKDIADQVILNLHRPEVRITVQDLPCLYGVRQRLEEVFRKIIANAVMYGGTSIVVGYADKTFFVRDDGIGIPLDQLETIFKPGERLKDAGVDGAGLSLTFCRKVIEQHGGDIRAESEGPGFGATFYFSLPVKEYLKRKK